MKKQFLFLKRPGIVLLLSLLLTWCSNSSRIAGGASETENATAKLRITLGDSPPPKGVEHLNLDIHAVEIYSESQGWVVAAVLDTIIDLVDLSRGGKVVLADTMLPVGPYTALRVVFGPNNSVTINGKNHILGASAIPDSGYVVSLDFSLVAHQEMELYLDIDATKSVDWTLPTPELDPDVKPYIKSELAIVAGTVRDQKGNPIAAATVRALSGDSALATTLTDSTGEYELLLPAGSFAIKCESETHGPSNPESYSLAISAGDSLTGKNFRLADRINIRLGLIYGTVRDSASRPIEGALIQAWSGTACVAARSSDSSGFYALALVTGEYKLTCSARGFLSDTIDVRISAGDSIRVRDFAMKKVMLAPSLCRVGGTIKDSSGTPIMDAQISIKNEGVPVDSAQTDSAGIYSVLLKAGTYTILCSAQGYVTETDSLTVTPSDTLRRIGFVLTPVRIPRSTISGYIHSIDKSPVEGGNVLFWIGGAIVTQTKSDSTGSFRQDLAPGSYKIVCSAPGMVPDSAWLNFQDGDSVTVDFMLKPIPTHGWITGSVSDTNGNTIASARIEISDAAATTACTSAVTGQFETRIAFGQYSVSCSAAGYIMETTSIHLPSAETLAVNFRLKPVPPKTGLLNGTVLSLNETPISGASVSAWNNGVLTESAYSDSTGAFSLILPPAAYSLSCTADSYMPRAISAQITAGDTANLTLRLSSVYGLVAGTVLDKKNRPMGFVTILATSGSGKIASAVTDASGSYSMLLAQGSYSLSCSTLAFQLSSPQSQSIAVQGNDTLRNLDFQLRNDENAIRGFVSGQVRDSAGRPVEGAVVTAKCCGDRAISQYTAADGHYRLVLEPGEYYLTCKADGYNCSDPKYYKFTIWPGRQLENMSFRMHVVIGYDGESQDD